MKAFTRCIPSIPPGTEPDVPSPLQKLTVVAPRALNRIMSMVTIFDLFSLSLISEKWKTLVQAFHSEQPDNAVQSIQLVATYEKQEISISRRGEDHTSWVFALNSSTGFYEMVYPSIPVLEHIICWEWRAEIENVTKANDSNVRHVLKFSVTEPTAIKNIFEILLSIFTPKFKKITLDLDLDEEFGVIEFLDSVRKYRIDTYMFSSKDEVDEMLTTVLTRHPQSKELRLECNTPSQFSCKIKHLNVEDHFHSKKSKGIVLEELLQMMNKGTKEICLYETSFDAFAFKVLVLTTRTVQQLRWKKITLQLSEEINIHTCFESEYRSPASESTDRRAVVAPDTFYTFSRPRNNASEVNGFHLIRKDGLIITVTVFDRLFACVYLQDTDSDLLRIISSLDHTPI